MTRTAARAGVAAIGLAIAVAGCASRCKRVRRARAALEAARPPSSQPHAVLTIPHAVVDALLAPEVAALEPLEVPVPGLLRIAPVPIPRVTVRVKSVRMAPAPAGHVGMTASLDIHTDGELLLSVELEAHARPRVEGPRDARVLAVAFDGDSVEWMRPRLGTVATQKIASLLHQRLPEKIRAKIPMAVARLAVERLVAHLGDDGYAVIRKLVLARLGNVATMRLHLPAMPVERADVSTVSGGTASSLRVAIHTGLPVRRGLRPDQLIVPSKGRAITVIVSGSAAAEIANWAIRSGVAPQRYNRELKPDPKGLYHPVFDWRDAPRPLHIHVFRIGDWCTYTHVSATPSAYMRDGKLWVTARDRTVERFIGPAHVRAAIWLKGLWWSLVDKTKGIVSSAQLQVGGRVLRTRVTAVHVDGRAITMSVRLERVESRAAGPLAAIEDPG